MAEPLPSPPAQPVVAPPALEPTAPVTATPQTPTIPGLTPDVVQKLLQLVPLLTQLQEQKTSPQTAPVKPITEEVEMMGDYSTFDEFMKARGGTL